MFEGKLKWSIVGLGDIVRKRVGPALLQQPQSALVACVTRDPASRTDDLASLQPNRIYADFAAMLTDPEIDAVYLATPVFLHAPQAIAALQAGKHVLVEKPMAMDTGEGKAMIAAAKDAGRYLAVAYYRRFWPAFQQTKEILERGELGQITLLRVALHSWYSPTPSEGKTWRIRPEQSGGGVVSDVGSHRLDLLAWWFGLPKRVVADMATRTHRYSVDDSTTALITFGDDVPCTLSFHWNSKTWTDEIHIVGTEAKITFTAVDGDEMLITRGRDTICRKPEKPANAHAPLIDDFVRAILENRAPRFSGADSLVATQMMDSMIKSAILKSWVEIG